MYPNKAVRSPDRAALDSSHGYISEPDPISLDQRVAELAAAIRGEAPTMALLGGARAIDRAMFDDASYELLDTTPPVIEGLYWVVEMTFRSRTCHDAKQHTKRFYIQQGHVVRIDTVD